MEPWYKIVTPRKEVREGRSFNPDEFAIALEQVVAGTAPEDYRDPAKFFSRTCFTRALIEHTGMVLRRLSGETTNTAPVMALVTQFGGGKTHTLTALYHLIKNGNTVANHEGVQSLMKSERLKKLPSARVAVFVGNAWDPSKGKETPWLDIARQLAGDSGADSLGPEAKSKAPGTDNLRRLFEAAGGRVLVLCDEVLNFLSRHGDRADSFRDFLANLVRAMTGTTGCAAMISLPQSKPELSDRDQRWQEIIVKEVGRVAKQLIANDETEISEVVRRRLFEDLGSEKIRRNIALTYAEWCFERRAQLPAEWTAIDTATTKAKAREFLQKRFEACYPFHPATLSVFQRKWQSLAQYQQTRGTLAMLAQWISLAYKEGHINARKEPLITLGSAPLEEREFRSVVLGQLGESKLEAAINADIAGDHSHSRAFDADTQGPLRDIHRRVGTAILFESSGGQIDKVAHLPELRFALGEPEIDTTSVDTAVLTLETKAYYIRKIGSDGFKIHYSPTLKKVVSDRRASLDADTEVRPVMEKFILDEFKRGASIPVLPFPSDSTAIQDSPRLSLVVMHPSAEWDGRADFKKQIAEWTKQRGESPRLFPASLIWCLKKPGKELRDHVENLLAWKRVKREMDEGILGSDIDKVEKAEVPVKIKDAEEACKDEVWASYRYVVLADGQEKSGLKVIDLGAGHASAVETLCGRIIAALKSAGLLSESVGASYIDRAWPPALKESGAWPLSGLRQSFLNGSLTRLLDPDAVLKNKIVEFVGRGEFGLAWGQKPDGTYEDIRFNELIGSEDVRFESDVFLLKKSRAKSLKARPETQPAPGVVVEVQPEPEPMPHLKPVPGATTNIIRLRGNIPPEVWNRLGTKILPKLRSGKDLKVGVELSATVNSDQTDTLVADLKQIVEDLGLADQIHIETL